ncbi:MAG: L,D-transpeptidase [Chloroflexota bacterium]
MGGPRASRMVAAAIFGAVVLVSMACAAMEPTIKRLAGATPTPQLLQAWSVVQISKPTQTQPPPAPTPMPTVENSVPEAAPTPSSEDPPVITMVIAEEGSEAVNEGTAPEAASLNGKHVLVSISEQHLYAYENDQLVYSFAASTGMGNSTRVGSFQVLDKIPNAYGANWNIWMPNWMGIYWSGSLENGIHALPILPGGARLWAGYLGIPISYGCVVLGVDEALQLYNWADVGTPVQIRW